MDKKYNPADFEYPLNEYMEKAYQAYDNKDVVAANYAAADIDLESKLAMKDGIISERLRSDIRKYFLDLYIFIKANS